MNFLISIVSSAAMRVMIIIMIIMLHSEIALATASSLYYKIEYERKDISGSSIRKGTVLSTVYLAGQTLKFRTKFRVENSLYASLVMGPPVTKSEPDPGCTPVESGNGGDGSIGILRFNGKNTESQCLHKAYDYMNNLTALKTGTVTDQDGTWYEYSVTVPKTKLVDIVVNDPNRALLQAGQMLTITAFDLPFFALQANKAQNAFPDGMIPESDVQVLTGEVAASAFFPNDFMSSTATRDLKVHSSNGDRFSGAVAGETSIDMCLYDGAGLSKSRYKLKFADTNLSNTTGDFAIYRTGGREKIEYTVTLTDPSNNQQNVTNNVDFDWLNMENGGAARSRVRYVRLPDRPSINVPCVPSTVTLKVKPVPYLSLRAGDYKGDIKIIFTASTS